MRKERKPRAVLARGLGMLYMLSSTVATGVISPSPTPDGEAVESTDHAKSFVPSVEEVCLKISRKLSSVGFRECTNRRLRSSGARSVEGIPILIKEYPPLPSRKVQARVLILGGIHGDEYSSVSIVFKWMKTLDEHHSGLFHWRVAPLLNPDGLLRKKSQRMNANGVDLNRNFPTPDWGIKSRDYWIRRTGSNPRRYPGPQSASEPESRWLVEEIERFNPHAIIAIHAPFGIVDFDGPPSGPSSLGHLHLNPLGTYPGSLGNYAGLQKKIPVITIELASAGIMPTTRQSRRVWTDLVRWLKHNLPREQAPAAHSADIGAPLDIHGPVVAGPTGVVIQASELTDETPPTNAIALQTRPDAERRSTLNPSGTTSDPSLTAEVAVATVAKTPRPRADTTTVTVASDASNLLKARTARTSPDSAPEYAQLEPTPSAPDAGSTTTEPTPSEVDQAADQLMARGDRLLTLGDVAAARLFYELAAEYGKVEAAAAVGKTYDPLYLKELGALGFSGDLDNAIDWYKRAIEGGDTEAIARLKALTSQ